jgi:hypothetical protein
LKKIGHNHGFRVKKAVKMSYRSGLSQWEQEVSRHMPQLSRCEARVLAWYSFGMVMAGTCGLLSASVFLGELLGVKAQTVRQRLRELTYEASRKRGKQRREVVVEDSFGALLAWVLSWWEPGEKRIALALDATGLGQRYSVLAVSVVYRGCAIPVAWVILPKTKPGAWKPHWKRLLCRLEGAIPEDWTVIVLTDRGLYAKWLYKDIQARGWHPFMRINAQGLCRVHGTDSYQPIAGLVPSAHRVWAGTVDCFKTPASRLRTTLLCYQSAVHKAPWLILTDLPPAQADLAWYGMRMWIEAGFKDIKRGGWHWEQTKMKDPQRVARLWLVIAVATLWTVAVGSAAEQTDAAIDQPAFIMVTTGQRRGHPRLLSLFRRGMLRLRAWAMRQPSPLPPVAFFPDPWPVSKATLEALC